MTIMNIGEDVKSLLNVFIKMLSRIEKEECFSFTIEYIPDEFVMIDKVPEKEVVHESSHEITK